MVLVKLLRYGIIAVAVFSLSAFAIAQTHSVIGILEESPGNQSTEPPYRSVRIAFARDEKAWKAFDASCTELSCLRAVDSTLSPATYWTVTFDGKILGQVTTKFADGEAGKFLTGQFAVEGDPIPTVGKSMQEFAGWLGEPVHRPLILLSRRVAGDPDQWKPVQLTNTMSARLRNEFKRLHPKLTNCQVMRSTSYSASDIRVVKSYKSQHGWKLVQLSANHCAPGDERGDPLTMEWFVLSPSGEIKYLDSNLHLVDAGDYDGEGKSELVFQIDDYNRGGYKLFYDDFRQKAVFEFSYH